MKITFAKMRYFLIGKSASVKIFWKIRRKPFGTSDEEN